MTWRKSSFSAQNGQCVEVERDTGMVVAVRNSNALTLGKIYFTENEWKAFIAGVKAGEFDLEKLT